jgi:hypothetical protein
MAERILPGLGLTGYWDLGSSGWKPGMDANLRLLSAIVQGAALSRTDALPGVPVDGDISIVPASDLTNPNKIAIRDDGAWVYITPLEGFRMWIIDDEEFCLYDGATWGPLPTAFSQIADMLDVDVSTPPTEGQTLVWDDGTSKWIPGAGAPETLGDIGDVDLVTDPPTDGQALVWDTTTSTWIPGDAGGVVALLGDIGDVDLVTDPPTDGQALVWDTTTSTWIPGSAGVPITSFGIALSTTGTPDASELMFRFISPGAFTLPTSLTGSAGYAGTAPSGGDVVFDIKKNGSSIGSMTFLDTVATASFTFASPVAFVAGDRFEIVAPADVQGIEDVSATFIGDV